MIRRMAHHGKEPHPGEGGSDGPVRVLVTGYGAFMGIENNPSGEIAERLGKIKIPGAIVKTMVLTDGARVVAAIVPGDRRLDRKKVARAVGSGTLRFASAAEVAEHTGYPPGGVAPLAFAGPVTVVVDESLMAAPGREVVAGGGRPELLVRVAVAELIRHNQAVVAAIARDDT
jgi:prolyl-tRNA editing enzyme YbaK/EbsC (Cys-tRNA(Pro) deacylase)